MTIDWTHFTPYASLAGGIIIGLAAAIFILFNGRVAGISGILGGLTRRNNGTTAWRIAFIVGLLAAPLAYQLASALPASQTDASWAGLVAAGLLVGIGTQYGSGCTSGHGVCGLSRMSLRSLVATLTFMIAGFVTVFVLRHWVA